MMTNGDREGHIFLFHIHMNNGEARTHNPQSRVKHSTTEPLHSLYGAVRPGLTLVVCSINFPINKGCTQNLEHTDGVSWT